MALDAKRFACEKVLQPSSDNVSYRHFVECGYVRTRVIDEVSASPLGIYVVSAAPGYGKTATAKIFEAECASSGRCIPVYVQLSAGLNDIVYNFLSKEFKRLFVDRGGEVLRRYVGDYYVDKLKKNEEYFLDVLGMMYCSKACGGLPRSLLLVDELTAPFAAGSAPRREDFDRAIAELDRFLRDVQNAYCNPIGGIVLLGHWTAEERDYMRRALSSTVYGGLDRVRHGDVRVITDSYFKPVGDSARQFAEGVLRAYGLAAEPLILDVYAGLVDVLPLRKANRFLYWIVNGTQPSSEALAKLSHLVEEELAGLLGGRARVRESGREHDVLLPDGGCVEVKVRSRIDPAEAERLTREYKSRGCATVIVSPECGGAPQCVEVKAVDAIATALLGENLLEVDKVQFGVVVEKVARPLARRIAELARGIIKVGPSVELPRDECRELLRLYEEDCKLLNRRTRSEWRAKSRLLKALNGWKQPKDVDEVEAIIKRNKDRLEKCGIGLEVRGSYIACR